ncbi:MAG: potassium transporter KefB [Rhodospirillaceae bacterium]|jgi:monovalent cation:H+ antiporter-2, CPA2 family|nr:potassium transporter KefB [Rhodospirillaceae bacterium]MBT5564478.1 potassium transporter KefB [Rhodospirillaceae bacterium]MBT6089768.1 potassium transporter KefB [Rhodospirillaceae bacterium]
MHILADVIVLLAAGVSVVALFQWLGFGAVLGYLVAGSLIGPYAFGFITETEIITLLGEYGVVFLLFIIGLELPLERIRVMRGPIFGLGLLQILATGLLIFLIALWFDFPVETALLIGAALSLSSTAVVLALLSDQGRLTTHMGRSVFGVLLMQDLAVGPLLAVVVAVGVGGGSLAATLGMAGIKMIAAIVIILGLGRWLLGRVFMTISSVRSTEVFAGFTLLVLLCAAALTEYSGLSLAFGALLAGMLLADTPYRHQVAAEILPFRGLLLGLFFMGVGMGIDIDLVLLRSSDIALLVISLMTLKAVTMFLIARLSGLSTVESAETGVYLSQGGEFAFVLLAAGASSGLVEGPIEQVIAVAVALSMLLTPLFARATAFIIARWELATAVDVDAVGEEIGELKDHIIIIGVGRVGREVAVRLEDAGRAYVSLDLDPHAIAVARQQGISVYFGDATRPEVLDAVGLNRALALVIAIDDPHRAVQMMNLVKYILPDLKVYARARDAQHAKTLERAGAASTVPEVIPTATQLADLALKI